MASTTQVARSALREITFIRFIGTFLVVRSYKKTHTRRSRDVCEDSGFDPPQNNSTLATATTTHHQQWQTNAHCPKHHRRRLRNGLQVKAVNPNTTPRWSRD